MVDPDEAVEDLMEQPRIGFLISAAVTAVLAIVAYLLEDSIVGRDGDGALTFAFLLIVLVLACMVMLVCYRVPRLGNRLLGYHRLNTNPKPAAKSDMQYTAGFKSETGVDTKRQSSRRKQARHSRKKLAAITREMQQQATEKPEQDKPTE